jgi:hypothetical protein
MSCLLDVYICSYLNRDLKTCDHNHGKCILVQMFCHGHQLLVVVLVFRVMVAVVHPFLSAFNIHDSSVSYPLSSRLYCNLCSCNLTLLDAQKVEWFYTRCNVSCFPNKGEKVKRANKFETPGPPTDKHGYITGEKTPIVSMVEDGTTTKPRKSVFPRSLESLIRPGVTITGFNSTVDNESL